MGGGDAPDRDMATMIRGVRFAFLAVAALAAGAGWFVGQPLLLVVALVIAGVDVVETTLLLIVARTHRGDEPGR
jgi:fatty acid desaturase